MRIGHCQLESVSGDFDGNLAKVVAGLERADRERVQIVCFPECFLTGYQDTEAATRAAAVAADSPQFMRFLERVGRFNATCVVGFNELRGRDLYNTAAVVTKGHVLGIYSKCSAYMPFHKQGQAGAHGALGVVFLPVAGTEHRQQAVTGVLQHLALM